MLFNTSLKKLINPYEFCTDDFYIEDIAQGLSRQCRFAGQCERFYSVAEHSYHLSKIVPEQYALQALLHDGAEAYIGDISRPWKELLPDFSRLEHIIINTIYRRYGVEPNESVYETDTLVGNYEAYAFFGTTGFLMREIPIKFWKPNKAQRKFMERFHQLYTLTPKVFLFSKVTTKFNIGGYDEK